MFATVRLLSTGISTIGTVKALYDNFSQHLFFRDEIGNIFEVSWSLKSGWEIVNITSEYKLPMCRCTPIAFCTSTGLEYIYYYSDNGHIYQLYRNGAVTTWTLSDISELANATQFVPIGNLVCWSVLGTDRIFFTTENGHVIELFCLHNVSYIWKAGWKAHDLNLKTFSSPAKVVQTNIPQLDADHSLDNILSGSLLDEEEFDFIQKSQIRNSPTQKDYQTLLTSAQQQIHLAEKTNEQIMHLFSLIEKEVAVSPRLNESQKHSATQNVWSLNDQFSKIVTREVMLSQKLQDVKASNRNDRQTQTYHNELLQLQPEKLKVACDLLEQLHNIPEYSTCLCGHIGIGSTSQYVFYYGTDNSVYQLRWGWALPRPTQKNDEVAMRSSADDNSYDLPDEALKANPQSTAWDWIKVMSSTISSSTAKLAEMSRTTPFWKATNISKRVSISPLELIIGQVCDAYDLISTVVGQPTSHCTPTGSHHLFYLTFPDCHVHEYYWTPLTSWKHRDITVDTKCPLAAPRGQIRSYCNTVSLYHYLYYLDNNGHVYELRQSLTSDTSWTCTDVTELMKAQEVAIPQAKQLLLATTHPINKNFNAVAVYYLDSASHIIELTCHVKLIPSYKVTWTYVDLSIRQKLVGVIQPPIGGMSGYVKGFIESLSASTQSSISSAVSIVKGLTFGASKQPTDVDEIEPSPEVKPKQSPASPYAVTSGNALFHSDENDSTDNISPSTSPRKDLATPNRGRAPSTPQAKQQDVSQRLFLKLQEESNRLREQSSANEKLQEQIVQLQVQNKELSALQAQSKESADKQLETQLSQLRQQQEQEIERLKQQLEANEQEKVQTQEKLELLLKQWEQEQREQQEKFRRLMMETEIYKEQLQAEANMRKQKEEETQIAIEEREKLLMKLKEDEEKVHVLTNGLGWEMYKKVNLQGQNNNNEEEECIICFDPKPLVKLNPCGHKNVCQECFDAIAAKDNSCPKCRTPVQSISQ